MHLAAAGSFPWELLRSVVDRAPSGRGEQPEPVNLATCTNHQLSCPQIVHKMRIPVKAAYRAMHNVTGGRAVKTFKM